MKKKVLILFTIMLFSMTFANNYPNWADDYYNALQNCYNYSQNGVTVASSDNGTCQVKHSYRTTATDISTGRSFSYTTCYFPKSILSSYVNNTKIIANAAYSGNNLSQAASNAAKTNFNYEQQYCK